MASSRTGGQGTGDGPGAAPTAPYVVLARKYRPETFDDLIGQEAMVRTLRNAFASDRIAQGYMLTGVRGIGKTTTARILARALNYEPDTATANSSPADSRPTVDMPGYGRHCLEIIQSRHPDVMEMDAASNTGIESVREIIEQVRYKPISGRYKVYIIDEVHMLSKSAFNALLKTLEEPPEHVKFIFATTEIRKVPVTVLSRCQRFDLRRVDVPVLAAHLARIAGSEGASTEDEAITLIARAAGGSVRDGLSILDQAIAMGAGAVTSDAVRGMLGLADRGRVFDLLETLAAGDARAALLTFDTLYRDGADAMEVLADVAEAVHATTRAKTGGADTAGEGLTSDERRRAGDLAGRLSMSYLSRLWQMLLKGVDETSRAPDQRAAVEMVLIRVAHMADLPSPDEVIRLLGGEAPRSKGQGMPVAPRGDSTAGAGTGPDGRNKVATPPPRATGPAGSAAMALASPPAPDVSPPVSPAPPSGPQSFAEVVALIAAHRDARLMVHLEQHVRLLRFEPGRIELKPLEGAPPGLAGELGERLGKITGQRWIVSVGHGEGDPTIAEVRKAEELRRIEEARQDPAVRAILDTFTDAVIRPLGPDTSN